jgi:pimeloyl-ACP methyl ester carboxylesterase
MNQPIAFKINISDQVLDDLQHRLKNTRWPDQVKNAGWDYGTNLNYLKEFCNYWHEDYNWRVQETQLNLLHHFLITIDDIDLHFIHEKGKGKRSVPLLLTHGFPDSFVRFLKLIPLLTAEDKDGFSFDVIIPSIPGYGFSDRAAEKGMSPIQVADLFAALMSSMGHSKFMAHGGDWGSSITEQLALNHADVLAGIHLTDIPYKRIFSVNPDELTPEEKQFIQRGKQWSMQEGAYAMIQATKPQTLAYGINDSPAGLAGWILELFRSWCDCDGNLENKFTKDELLTNISIYWFTQTVNSAFRLYYESMKAPDPDPSARVNTPTAGAIFPKDIVPSPQAFAKRFFNIKQWTEMPRGGHFAAMEEPHLLAADIRTFAKKLEQ